MTHVAEQWTDRNGDRHVTCGECQDSWPCANAPHNGRPAGWLIAKVDPEAVLDAVAHGFRVSVEDILGTSRKRHFVVARACAMAVVKQHTNLSYPAVGALFRRDHTTVMHHVSRVLRDPELSEAVRQVVEELSPPAHPFAVADALFLVGDAPAAEEAV